MLEMAPVPSHQGKADLPLCPRVKGRGKPLDQASPSTGCCADTAPEHPKSLAPACAGPLVTPQINPSATAAPGTPCPRDPVYPSLPHLVLLRKVKADCCWRFHAALPAEFKG